MADQKITQLTSYNPPIDADVIAIVDSGSGVTKKITWGNVKSAMKASFTPATGFKTQVTVGAANADYITTGTNDEVQIQAAITDAASSSKRAVIFPGTYNIYAAISIPSNVVVKGAGIGLTILQIPSAASTGYKSDGQIFINSDVTNGNSNIAVEDIEFKGVVTVPTQSGNNSGIYFRLKNTSNITFRRLKASGFNVQGFRIEPITLGTPYVNILAEDIQTDGLTTGAGISFGTRGSNIIVNRFTGGSRDSAVALFEPIRATVTNCIIDGSNSVGGQGIEFSVTQNYNAEEIIVTNNIVKSYKVGSGIYFSHLGGSSTFQPSNIIIADNICQFNEFSGITVNGGYGVQITGNNCSFNLKHGIDITAGSSGVFKRGSVTGNICHSNSTSSAGTYHGININGQSSGIVQDSLFTNNECFDDQGTKTQGYGISMSGDATSEVIRNYIYDNKLDGNLTGALLQYGDNNVFSSTRSRYTVGPFNADFITDGTADEVQIQAAIDAANVSSGMVYLNPGIFNTAATIQMKSNVMLVGAGMGVSIIKGANAVYTLIKTTRSGTTPTIYSNIHLRDITFFSQHDAVVEVNNCNGLTIKGIECYYNVTTPISESFVLNYNSNLVIEGNYLHDLTGNGIQVNACQYFTVVGNVINGVNAADTDGIDIDVDFQFTHGIPSSYGTIVGNTVRNCTNGMRIENGNNFAISGNTVLGSTDTGIYINTSDSLSLLNISVTGNTIDNCVNAGITVTGSPVKGIMVSGNAVNNCGQAGGSNVRGGIIISAANVSVVGNYVVACGKTGTDGGGIVQYLTNSSYIASNYVQDCATGIRAWNGSGTVVYSDVVIAHNKMTGNSTDYAGISTQTGIFLVAIGNTNGMEVSGGPLKVTAQDILQSGGNIIANTSGPLYLQTSTVNPINFRINAVEKMRVNSDGRVGIGTSSPPYLFSAKEDSNGEVGISHENLATVAAGTIQSIFFRGYRDSDANHTVAKVSVVHGQGSAGDLNHTGSLLFHTNTGLALTERMRITPTGQVGIGATPATSAALEIASTTGALLVPRMTTTQKNALTAVNGMFIYDSTLNKFQGYENGTWTSFI